MFALFYLFCGGLFLRLHPFKDFQNNFHVLFGALFCFIFGIAFPGAGVTVTENSINAVAGTPRPALRWKGERTAGLANCHCERVIVRASDRECANFSTRPRHPANAFSMILHSVSVAGVWRSRRGCKGRSPLQKNIGSPPSPAGKGVGGIGLSPGKARAKPRQSPGRKIYMGHRTMQVCHGQVPELSYSQPGIRVGQTPSKHFCTNRSVPLKNTFSSRPGDPLF